MRLDVGLSGALSAAGFNKMDIVYIKWQIEQVIRNIFWNRVYTLNDMNVNNQHQYRKYTVPIKKNVDYAMYICSMLFYLISKYFIF